ncbi:MAG: ABC transporter permease [Sedimentisphaerales bacterium]|nr:ABC transporter permease [Sedimentisphaerales bacterium]
MGDYKKKVLIVLQMPEVGVLIPLVVLSIVIGIINSAFYSFENLINVLRSTSFIFITAIGMTIVLVSAGLDLSVGSVMALGSYVTALALTNDIPMPLCIVIGIATGMLIGIINGLVVVRLNIPPFIATLGMFYMAKGMVLIASKGIPIYPLPDSFNVIGQGSFFNIPYIVIIALFLGVLADFILKKTTFGRNVYAIGGNAETARLSGISVDKLKLSFYVIVGGLAAFTGLLLASRMGSAQPSIGQQFELKVIAAVIIGGTSLFGGKGTIMGTFLGALFMTVLTNGMSLMRVSPYWQQLIIGAIIILAVAMDQYKRRKK